MGETKGNEGTHWYDVDFGPVWAGKNLQNTLPKIRIGLFTYGKWHFGCVQEVVV